MDLKKYRVILSESEEFEIEAQKIWVNGETGQTTFFVDSEIVMVAPAEACVIRL